VQTGSKRWKNGITLKVHAWSHEMPLYYQEFSIPPKARPMLMSDSKDVAMAAKNMGARG
jgi:hypothetical protein